MFYSAEWFFFSETSFLPKKRPSHSAHRSLNPNELRSTDSRHYHTNNKTDDNKSHRLFYGVDEVTILEPNDNETIPQKTLPNNVYQRIVYIMKQSTQEYYNMRMILGLECK